MNILPFVTQSKTQNMPLQHFHTNQAREKFKGNISKAKSLQNRSDTRKQVTSFVVAKLFNAKTKCFTGISLKGSLERGRFLFSIFPFSSSLLLLLFPFSFFPFVLFSCFFRLVPLLSSYILCFCCFDCRVPFFPVFRFLPFLTPPQRSPAKGGNLAKTVTN